MLLTEHWRYKTTNDDFFSPINSSVIGFSHVLDMALPFKISKIIRCHKWQIHTHKIKWTSRFTRATTTAKNKLDATAANVEHTRDAWVLCNSLLMTTSLIDIVIENDALYHYPLHLLAEAVTFLNSSRVSFLYSWRCKDIGEKSGSL